MPPLDDLKDSLTAILNETIQGMNPSAEDRENLLIYGQEVVKHAVKAKMSEGADKDIALAAMQGYEDAISLVIARYEVRAGVAAEKALMRVLAQVTKFAVAALA